MNRCVLGLGRGLCALLLGASCAVAQTPQRVPPMPVTAERGWLQMMEPPLVALNGQPERLAPGARIRGTNNLIQLPAALHGQLLAVAYVRDPQGLLREVWILSEAEVRAIGSN